MDKVRIGLVGKGFAARLHLDSIAGLRGLKADVVAYASRNPDRDFAAAYGIPDHYDDYKRLLERDDIDVVDLCIPTDLHEEFCTEAARAGKHIICEKPLTGYFGKDQSEEQIGFTVSKSLMLRETMEGCRRVAEEVERNRVKFMYAENWVYAPPFVKLKNLMRASQGTILDMRSELSHSGSQAPYSRQWKTSGGGSLMRLGAHPVGAVLHLKHYEGLLKSGRPIRAKSVTAEVGFHSKIEAFQQETKKYVVSNWEDVEDWGVMVIAFEDGSNATVFSSDGVLGGVRNTINVYLSNSVVHVNINPNNAIEIYAPDAQVFEDEFIAERLETKAGWNFPNPDDNWMRGYAQEMDDFIDDVRLDRVPASGLDLATDTVEVIYAAYVSAEEGRRIEIGT
ncbi:MAG: Gfo/Idh/MocA family oxidoreductase [Desulfomonile tiedjei]|nr:Gfo/Idh/MocA family oxidoreductase [Desulfomonile tiedjei]